MTRSAFLVMDIQRSILDRFDGDSDYLPRLRRAIDAARAAGVPVVYVVVGFAPSGAVISPRNKAFSGAAASGNFDHGSPGAQIHPVVAPRPGDPIVTKRRVSAFAGSDLDLLLRALDIDTLVLSGVATSGVVLSTVRDAADRDFGLTVLADGCLDSDPEVHRVLTEKVFPRQAAVLPIDEWAASLA